MMGRKRSVENCLNWEIYVQGFVWFVLIFTARISSGITNPADVSAINNLYAALGYPTLPGWVPTGGDPCAEAWQGVVCDSTNIISITLNAANLGGELGDDLDLSNNHIGGSIPSNLPVTMQNIFLSANQFNGSIPSSLSTLTQLSAMSLNENRLTGEIPDAFQFLIGDLSSNNLSRRLPTSLENLSSLTTLHLQNNQLSGTLDVLQDLPLKDLNIENNLFTGPVPENLLTIPNFKGEEPIHLDACGGLLIGGQVGDKYGDAMEISSSVVVVIWRQHSTEARRKGDKLDGGRLMESGAETCCPPSVYLKLGSPSGTLVGIELPCFLEKDSFLWSAEEVEGLLCVQRSIYLDLELMDPGRGLALRSSMVGSILGGGKDGNQFNTTSSPLPSPTSPTPPPPAPPLAGAPSSGQTPGKKADGPSNPEETNSKRTKNNTKRIVWISIAGVLSFIVLVLALLLFMPRCWRGIREADRISKRHEVAPYVGIRDNPMDGGPLVQPINQIEKVPKAEVVRPKEEHQTWPRRTGLIQKPRNDPELNVQRISGIPKQDDHELDMSRLGIDSLKPPPPPPSPPPPPPQFEKVIVNPIAPTTVTTERPSTQSPIPQISVKSYTIAFLQQYTNSFSQDNLIGAGRLGTVYRAELPNGKLLAIKKLDKRVSSQQKDEEFFDLVNSIDQIRHANVVELMGYCAEYGQRLLIYEYCSKGTLQDAFHSDDEFKGQLTWNIRIRIALGAARALEYLHEVCEPPIIHRNFKSANVLLDDELAVHVSDCGLASLISSGSLSGNLLTAYGYGAPEFELGIYTLKSDVFSFGVVMLELLTGRKSHDRTRNRGEQFLVRWAITQLHDIDALSSMVDPSLNGTYPAKSLSHFADIISRCVQFDFTQEAAQSDFSFIVAAPIDFDSGPLNVPPPPSDFAVLVIVIVNIYRVAWTLQNIQVLLLDIRHLNEDVICVFDRVDVSANTPHNSHDKGMPGGNTTAIENLLVAVSCP
ncbi:STRUBBELIG-receptor family 3 [Actinidia rufa]|uniref:STRUBBELIG-receptor family 3 n=1 Tax=Actinidia rufa TaxID=165716 RepID=A0A7J0DT30_9ERIC|nr:STRUBBELIG-receptor family 3 [Actinidia rufa]